jgi:hypothetical protein
LVGLVSWQASLSFMSQLSSKSALTLAGFQLMLKCQVGLKNSLSLCAPCLLTETKCACMKNNLDFLTQRSSKTALTLAGLQHMKKCQVGLKNSLSLCAPCFLTETKCAWKMVYTVGSLSPIYFNHESFALITRPRLLAN